MLGAIKTTLNSKYMDEQPKEQTIDIAISICEQKVKQHLGRASLFLITLFAIAIIFIGLLITEFYKEQVADSNIDLITAAMQNNIEAIKRQNETSDLLEKKLKETYNLIGLINDTKSKKDFDSLFKYIDREEAILLDFRKKLASTSYAIDTNILATRKISREILGLKKEEKSNSLLPYILFATFILVFGIIASYYRYHIKEASKFEQYHIGFLRIRIAGNNSSTGFEDLVKESLTKDAFNFDISRKKIENPLPGHPTSDIASTLINKILDNFELKQKAK